MSTKILKGSSHRKLREKKSWKIWRERNSREKIIMDIFTNKLSSVISSVSTTVEKLSSAMPGNQITREYDVGEQTCSAGIGKKFHFFSISHQVIIL